MVYIVEFADGTRLQVRAGNATDARVQAKARFQEKLIVAVRQAGLLGMAFRQAPVSQPQK